jgi:hypothetical protein
LSENEASDILSAYTALFHPAIFKRFGKIPQWESASGISVSTCVAELILVPPCCESQLSNEFDNIASDNNVTIIRNLKSRISIVNEIIKRFNIQHNFCNEFIADFYALGTTTLFVNLLAHHLHYMDNANDASIVQAFHDIIDNIASKNNGNNNLDSSSNSNSNIIETENQPTKNDRVNLFKSEFPELAQHNLFRDAFERICETKECYYPSSSYFLDLILTVRSTLGKPFRQLLLERECVNLMLPSLLLESLPDIDPESFAMLESAVNSGKVNFAIDDVSDVPLLLQPLLDVADKLLQGVSIYRQRLGITPQIYGRQKIGLAPFLPQILKLSGFRGVLFFAPLDGWHLRQRNVSKMIWKGVDGTKIDALIRYPKNCSTSKEFFEFADHYSELINSDSAPTAVFASFSTGRIKKIKDETNANLNADNSCNENPDADNFCNDNSSDNDSDDLELPDWFDDLRRMSGYTSQLGDFAKLESFFASTSQVGSEESIAVENFLSVEPSDIPFWIKLYRENLFRMVKSAFGTVSQTLDKKFWGKSISDYDSVSEAASDFVSAIGLRKVEKVEGVGESSRGLRRGIAIFNAWNFGRRAFIDASELTSLPSAVSPIIFAGELSNKKEIVVDVPPIGYVVIPSSEIESGEVSAESGDVDDDDKKDQNIEKIDQANSSLKSSGWSILTGLFTSAKKKLSLITRSEDKLSFLLQNEFFVAKIDSATGMLRSLFTGNYRYNRLSQQLGFRLPKALRDVDSRLAKDPNRGYASSVVDKIEIAELGVVTGSVRIHGRLICDDGQDAAKFTELVTIRKYSRILEFNIAIEPIIEPSGDSAWDSYYAIRSAWNDSSLELRGCLGDGLYSVTTNRVLSPRFIDLRTEKRAITFFSEGLPFHRRFGERYLDTILIAKGDNKYDAEGNKIDDDVNDNDVNDNVRVKDKSKVKDIGEDVDESELNAGMKSGKLGGLFDKASGSDGRVIRKFRYGVGIDIRHPPASSFEFMLMKNEMTAQVYCDDDKIVSRWLFRFDAANVVALHWEPFFDCAENEENNENEIVNEKNIADARELIGIKIHLLETEGIQTSGVLRSFKPVEYSYTTNLLGEKLKELNINEAGVQITMRPHELLSLVCLFRNKN